MQPLRERYGMDSSTRMVKWTLLGTALIAMCYSAPALF